MNGNQMNTKKFFHYEIKKKNLKKIQPKFICIIFLTIRITTF